MTTAAKKIPQSVLDRAEREVKARTDACVTFAIELGRKGKCDASLAPIWAHKLVHTFPKIQEATYPDLRAANGDVLPIDSSVDPADDEWDYYMIEYGGYADWIDDDGMVAPSSWIQAKRFKGKQAPFGHQYDWTIPDLERAAKSNLPLQAIKGKVAKRAHDAFENWLWLFGDASKEIVGLVTHPNITVSLARQNAGATSRLWSAKTDAEILRDLADLIDAIPRITLSQHFVARVFMTLEMMQICKNRLISNTATGTVTLWDVIKSQYSGDDTGQKKISFEILNECDADMRLNPKTMTDTSGVSGDFLLALPPVDSESACFIRSRPFSQLPPEAEGFKVKIMTHSKAGGCKLLYPTSVHRMDFGTT